MSPRDFRWHFGRALPSIPIGLSMTQNSAVEPDNFFKMSGNVIRGYDKSRENTGLLSWAKVANGLSHHDSESDY